jgi:hypothetical protein
MRGDWPSPVEPKVPGLDAVGRSQGPTFQVQYRFQPTMPMASTKRMLSSEERVRINRLLQLYSGLKAAQLTLFTGQREINT